MINAMPAVVTELAFLYEKGRSADVANAILVRNTGLMLVSDKDGLDIN